VRKFYDTVMYYTGGEVSTIRCNARNGGKFNFNGKKRRRDNNHFTIITAKIQKTIEKTVFFIINVLLILLCFYQN